MSLPFARRWVLAGLLCLGAPGVARAATLYEALGGGPGISRIGQEAIAAYMGDPRLHAYFDNINPDWLTPRFTAFLCHVTDGGCAYRGRSMGPAHRGLHIDEAAFNAVVEDLQAVMRREGVDFRTQNRLLARLAPMERDIVSR